MNTAAIARVEPTEAQLREAWTRLARRFGWRSTFEETMDDAIASKLVRITALHPPRPRAAAPVETPVPTRAPQHSASPAAARYHTELLPGFIDNKRRAAGERDDD